MTDPELYVAFDLGAESGRAVVGSIADDRLRLTEIRRFENCPVQVPGSLHWDVLGLWQEIKSSLAQVAAQYTTSPSGIGIAAWGSDFVLLDRRGALLGLPYHYRDCRTDGVPERLALSVPERVLFRETGISLAIKTTLCQLVAMREQASPVLDIADALLMMGDLFNFWLSGRRATETTLAGNTQFYHLGTRTWHRALLEKLSLPTRMLQEIVPSATILGTLLPSVAQEVGLRQVPVIAPACHDTLAACAAVPDTGDSFTFINSGTWSIIGTELARPLLTDQALNKGFINEAAVRDRILLAYNSLGLWPLQECRREWLRAGYRWSYAELTEMAAHATPFVAVLNPSHPAFNRVGDMTSRIAYYCRQSGQQVPAEAGTITRCLIEGLALHYRQKIEDIGSVTGRTDGVIHIVGGGARNALLCQFTADALRRPVIAGPVEATASGTVLLQALARGALASPREVRELIRKSAELIVYEPRPAAVWDEKYAAFLALDS